MQGRILEVYFESCYFREALWYQSILTVRFSEKIIYLRKKVMVRLFGCEMVAQAGSTFLFIFLLLIMSKLQRNRSLHLFTIEANVV